jgi:hypothetical protein
VQDRSARYRVSELRTSYGECLFGSMRTRVALEHRGSILVIFTATAHLM